MEDALYKARILDHFKHPRNKRIIDPADVESKGVNPACGDTLTLYLKFDGDAVADVAFVGAGCAISQAAASLLTEKLKGLTRSGLVAFAEADMYTLLGIEVTEGRKKCALLAWRALQDGVRDV